MRERGRSVGVLAGLALLLGVPGAAAPAHAALAEDGEQVSAAYAEAEPSSAPVEIDGLRLFRVRGVSALPAPERASRIAQRVEALAGDPAFAVSSLRVVESEVGTEVMAGDKRIMTLTDADARLEGVSRQALANVVMGRMSEAIEAHRGARSRASLTRGAALSLAATAALAASLFVLGWLRRLVQAALDRRFRERVGSVQIQSFQFLRAERIWSVVRSTLRTLWGVLVLVVVFAYLEYALAQFPWTRGLGMHLLAYVLDPARALARSVVAEIPSLLFLAVLCVVVWYLLTILHLFARAVARRDVILTNFDPDWAEPTFKLVRVLVVAFSLVVAYPYIPGSGSEAFKGISIFIGVIFSLGSSSAISNLIAGYMITYRRAFKIGDRIKIGETLGDVKAIRLQAIHVRTIKNEDVTIPNSEVLGNSVINYTSAASQEGLILHTTVGIGYETPWRQVEAMLLMAAKRSAGFLQEPAPFVLQQGLGDFAVTYEINAYCKEASRMAALYSELHRNILDVFNEYGVQIMTPAYEGDPEAPKVVAKEQWHTPPAGPGR